MLYLFSYTVILERKKKTASKGMARIVRRRVRAGKQTRNKNCARAACGPYNADATGSRHQNHVNINELRF